MFSSAFTSAKTFLHEPFQQPMDTVHLTLVVGLVMVIIILWTRVLALLPREIEI